MTDPYREYKEAITKAFRFLREHEHTIDDVHLLHMQSVLKEDASQLTEAGYAPQYQELLYYQKSNRELEDRVESLLKDIHERDSLILRARHKMLVKAYPAAEDLLEEFLWPPQPRTKND